MTALQACIVTLRGWFRGENYGMYAGAFEEIQQRLLVLEDAATGKDETMSNKVRECIHALRMSGESNPKFSQIAGALEELVGRLGTIEAEHNAAMGEGVAAVAELKTRGQVVAAQMIKDRCDILWRHDRPRECGVAYIKGSSPHVLDHAREAIASVIDAERRAERERIAVVVDSWEKPSSFQMYSADQIGGYKDRIAAAICALPD